MRTGAFLFALIALVAALAGCKDDANKVWGKENPERFQTAVSLSPGASEILGARLFGITIVGRTEQCNWPSVPKAPIVMKGVKPNFEQIAEIKPAIIVYDDQLFSAEDVAKIKELGIETFAITGNTVDEFTDCLFDLGTKMHGETSMSDYVDTIRAAVSQAEGAPPKRTLKVAVMMPGGGSEHMIVGTKSFLADVVRKAQGEPVGPDADKFVPANAEALVSMNPDVIFCVGKADQISKDPRLQSISAIKSKQVLPVNGDVFLRRGGRVEKLISVIYGYLAATAQESK